MQDLDNVIFEQRNNRKRRPEKIKSNFFTSDSFLLQVTVGAWITVKHVKPDRGYN